MQKHRLDDTDGPVKITREVPLPWLISMAVLLIMNGTIMWQGQQTQSRLIFDLTGEVKELRGTISTSGVKLVEHEIKLSDHDRRITNLEQKR